MSMAYIKKLKDIDNNTIYPQSITSAVVDKNGVTLEDLHYSFVKASNGEDIEDIDRHYESVSNKVVAINSSSTDSQYPSARAVYEAILANKTEGLSFVIVNELPTENINSKAIYLLAIESAEDSYDEYLYIDGQWEKIGATRIDLSNYYTKSESGDQFASKSIYADTAINTGRKSGTAIGTNSVAFGKNSTASNSSTLAGGYCTASGSYSTALGVDSIATACGAFAAGQGVKSAFAGQGVLGRYNIDDTESMFIVGNGDGEGKSNAFKVGLDGTAWSQGDIYVGSTSGTDKDAGSKKLATEEFVNNKIISSSIDIGEGAALEDGVIYLVYEE